MKYIKLFENFRSYKKKDFDLKKLNWECATEMDFKNADHDPMDERQVMYLDNENEITASVYVYEEAFVVQIEDAFGHGYLENGKSTQEVDNFEEGVKVFREKTGLKDIMFWDGDKITKYAGQKNNSVK